MSSKVVVVAGGAPADWPELTSLQQEETVWLGIDRGAYYLLRRGITPEAAIGDFDSLNKEELAEVEEKISVVEYSQPEKDYTDTQLGLLYAFKHYPQAQVTLIGGTGGRLDHFLSNLWLPLEPSFAGYTSQLTLADRQNTITYFQPGTYELTKEKGKKYLAFVCLTAVKDLTLVGTKYLLDKHSTTIPISFASNEFTEAPASFSFSSGVVAVIQSID